MQELLSSAQKVAAQLMARRQTVAVAESSAGGLIAAALLGVPGASAYFLGGAVVYTRHSRELLLGIGPAVLGEIRPSTEPYAALLARSVRARFAADWSLGETGAAGPSGNRYGDAPGHACIAVDGVAARVITVETGSGDRLANMRAFAVAGLDLLADCVARTEVTSR